MKSLWAAFNYLGLLLGVVFSLLVLSRRSRSTAATWAWLLSFFAFPFLAPFGYLLVGYSNMSRRKRPKPTPQKRLPEMGFMMKSAIGDLSPRFLPVAQLCENLSGFPPTSGNNLEFFEGQESIYQSLTDSLEKASHSIFLEYYIFRPDSVGQHFRDLLVRKAQEGVKVRVLVDHVGSFSLNHKFLEPLKQAGGEVAFFGKLTLKRPWGFQLRNHRKIAIVDGTRAFTGSQNICSDFRKWRIRKLDWIDSQVMIQGPAVTQLETVFLEDWDFTTGEKLALSNSETVPSQLGNSVVQILPTGPDEPPRAFEKILMALIHGAQARITLLTPYFIPTEAVAISLEAATRRGVQVEILVPRKSDHWLVDAASKSWYWELLRSGVKIWESPESFIHAKQITIDGEIALMGSANMDERSFRLNFENTTLIYDPTKVSMFENGFSHRLNQSHALSLENFSDLNFPLRIRDGLFRLVSPLL